MKKDNHIVKSPPFRQDTILKESQEKEVFRVEEKREEEKSPDFFDCLGMERVDSEEGEACLALSIKPFHLNGMETVHGGVLMALADTAMGLACESLKERVTTVDVQYRFLHPVHRGDRLFARGQIEKRGKTLLITRAELFVEDRLVGLASGSFFRLGLSLEEDSAGEAQQRE